VEIHTELLTSEGLRLFGRPRHRCENNNVVDIGEVWDDVWIGLIWLRRRSNGGLLWTKYWECGFLKRLGITWRAKL